MFLWYMDKDVEQKFKVFDQFHLLLLILVKSVNMSTKYGFFSKQQYEIVHTHELD